MRILIRYSDRTVQAAILLATIGSRVRAAVPGAEDAVEFTWTNQRWLAENGRAVEIEFDAAEWSAACEAAVSADSGAGWEPAGGDFPELWGSPFRLPTAGLDAAAYCRPAFDPAETPSAYLN
jgi:hypothetical protein